MKNLIYKHTDGEGNTMTVHKSGRTWLSCLGQIDEQLVRYAGPEAGLLVALNEEVGIVAEVLHKGQVYHDRDEDTPENSFTLTPTDQPTDAEDLLHALIHDARTLNQH